MLLVPKLRVSVSLVLGAACSSAIAIRVPLAWECLRHSDHSPTLEEVALGVASGNFATCGAFPDDARAAVLFSDVSVERPCEGASMKNKTFLLSLAQVSHLKHTACRGRNYSCSV
jgi:hypothetical protein